MNATAYSDSFLLSQFRAFYSEVVRLKRLAQAGTWAFAPEDVAEAEADAYQVGTAVWQQLLTVLEQQELIAGRKGGEYGTVLYKDAQYVMAALADEIFLHLDWAGREAWKAHLLETKLFHSHSAGEHLFEKIEQLLLEPDPVFRDLATVYLMALGLGFQGKFRGTDDAGQIDHHRRRLFAFIAHREPDLLNASRHLFPETYSHTLDGGRARKLPDTRQWIALVVGVVLTLVVLSSALWRHLTIDLYNVINRILVIQP
jgi:type VI secretion system protein ImpK